MASVELINFKEVIGKLKATNDSLVDMSPFFKEIGFREVGTTALRFKDQEDPEGVKWRDPKTIRRDAGGSEYSQAAAWAYFKKSNFWALPKGWHRFISGVDKAMIDTGNLRNSVQSFFSKDEAFIGTNLKYGNYVQALGFNFLGVSDKTRENIKEIYQLYLKGKL